MRDASRYWRRQASALSLLILAIICISAVEVSVRRPRGLALPSRMASSMSMSASASELLLLPTLPRTQGRTWLSAVPTMPIFHLGCSSSTAVSTAARKAVVGSSAVSRADSESIWFCANAEPGSSAPCQIGRGQRRSKSLLAACESPSVLSPVRARTTLDSTMFRSSSTSLVRFLTRSYMAVPSTL